MSFGKPKRTAHGDPVGIRGSKTTYLSVPQQGFTEIPDVNAPGSLVSSQNIWVRPGIWESRWKIQQLDSDTVVPVGASVTGLMQHFDVTGIRYQLVASRTSLAYLQGDSWSQLSYVKLSGQTDMPPSGSINDLYFGDSVYLPRADLNYFLFTNGVDPIYAWSGPDAATTFSTLTGAPACKDFTIFDNRPVLWNVKEPSSSSRLVQRVQWSARGDPETWNDVTQFSGFEDLLDMKGDGTRIFSEEDHMVLFSTEEVWVGRKVGVPFVFQFVPIHKEIGAPYGRSVIQTEDGIFWMSRDLNIHRLTRGRIENVGDPIRRTLVDTLQDPINAFLTWNPQLRQLTLWYTTTGGTAPNKAFTLHVSSGMWTPHSYDHSFLVGSRGPDTTASAATWGGLTGTFTGGSQIETYGDTLGSQTAQSDLLASSVGTVYTVSPSATSDDGTKILHEAVLGGILTQPEDRAKFISAVRLAGRAGADSAISIGVSPDLGRTYPQERTVTVVGQSETSQYKENFSVSGMYPTVRLQSDSATTWQLTRLVVEGRVRGDIKQ